VISSYHARSDVHHAHISFCRPAPHHTAEVLKLRFERDHKADWKIEYHQRRSAQRVAEDELKVSLVLCEWHGTCPLLYSSRNM